MTLLTIGQEKMNIALEQIAFDFYKDTLLKINPPKKKMTLWVELKKDNIFSSFPNCLKNFQIGMSDKLNINPSGIKKIVISVDRRFRIKKENTGKYPRVYCTVSFSNTPNQHIVTITEDYLHEGISYYIELDDRGKVIKWCKGGWL